MKSDAANIENRAIETINQCQVNGLRNSVKSIGVKSDALSGGSVNLARVGGAQSGSGVMAADPELVTLCRLWPSLAPDLRERIKGLIVEAVTGSVETVTLASR